MLNPNTTEAVTERLRSRRAPWRARHRDRAGDGAARRALYRDARRGVIGGAVALEMLTTLHRDVDAVIIAAFGDPALVRARAVPAAGRPACPRPHADACMLGRAFALVTFSECCCRGSRECVEWHGLPGAAPRSARSTRGQVGVGRAGGAQRSGRARQPLRHRERRRRGAVQRARRSPAWRAGRDR